MKILIIGSGGREHALAWKIKQSPLVKELYCAPGNGGISEIAQCIDIQADDIKALLRLGVDVGGDYFADKDYMVARLSFGLERTLEISNRIGKQDRINRSGRLVCAVELGELVGIPAAVLSEKQGRVRHISRWVCNRKTLRVTNGRG